MIFKSQLVISHETKVHSYLSLSKRRIQYGCRYCVGWEDRGLAGGDELSFTLMCQRDSLRLVSRPCGGQVGLTELGIVRREVRKGNHKKQGEIQRDKKTKIGQ
ncbi:hypothetical protein GOODEAATRI_008065 [Goodea atripinnis]|uniref:Uncharacterized protein n=1 Tax=Goodea atripinnis TaxID=208336 RepID=A0ABV0NSQ3_9TELE